MTYEQLQMSGLESVESLPKKSRLFPQASHVSLTALRERVGAIVTSVTCGERLKELSERLDRAGLSVKIRPVYFQEKINGISDESFPTLPRWGITSGGEYGALATWERRTSGSGCSLWRTPTASDGEFSGRSSERLADRWENQKQKHLSEQVVYAELQGGGYSIRETFPTPLSTDAVRVRYSEETLRGVGERRVRKEYKKGGLNLTEYVTVFPMSKTSESMTAAGNGGKLNPTWVEWLMGFPLGWTDLEGSETR